MTGNPQPDRGRAADARLESLLDQRGRPPVLKRSVDLEDWAGGIPQEQRGSPRSGSAGAGSIRCG